MSDKKYYSIQEERDDSETMIFPLNVQSSVAAKSSLTEHEKITIGITGWLFVCGIIGWVLISFLLKIVPRYAFPIGISIIVFLNATVGVFLLRYLLDEKSVIKEYEASEGASFASFFHIYRDTQLTLDNKYGVIEYSDGTYAAVMRFRLGYNTNTFAENTWMYTRDAVRIIASAGYTCKQVTMTENFKNSDTCKFMLDRLWKISNPELRKVQKEIIKGLIENAEKYSNVPEMYLLIYAHTQIQKDDLLSLIQRLERHFIVEQTCFRDIKFLNNDEIIEFLRQYYELEVLDMSLLRAQKISADLSFGDSFPILKMYAESGKIYTTEDMDTLNKRIIKKTHIKKVN